MSTKGITLLDDDVLNNISSDEESSFESSSDSGDDQDDDDDDVQGGDIGGDDVVKRGDVSLTDGDLGDDDDVEGGAIGGKDAAVRDDVADGKFQIAGHETMVFHDSDGNLDGDHSVASSKESSTSSTAESERERQARQKRQASMGHAYTGTLRKLRVLLWLVLGGIMILSTASVYVFSVVKETSVFHTEFKGLASKMIDSFQADAQRKLDALDSLSALVTVFASDHHEVWPNVTMPHSAPILERYLTVTGAAAIHILPIVPKTQRVQWEVYAAEHATWIDEALQETMYEIESSVATVDGPEEEGHGHDHLFRHRELQRIVPFIQNDNGIDQSEGPWAVTWQYAPISADRSIINYNHFTSADFVEETHPVLERQFATLSRIHTFSHGYGDQTRFETFMSEHFHEDLGFDERAHEPFVYLHYPVYEHVRHNSTTVAVITASLYWKDYFEGVLPEGVNGIICVVSNSLGQSFTYRIDGATATLMGLEDLHDKDYAHLELEGSYINNHEGVKKDTHTSVHLDEDFMSYTLRVYPSKTFEATYKTWTPVIVSLAMMMLFFLTAVVFKAYDWIIGRRQDTIECRAAKTEDIVASLFPETVRARILGEVDNGSESGMSVKKGKGKGSGKSSSGASVASGRSIGTSMTTYDASGVIADFYPEATVLFTDIKGFTAWCSEREPSQVFILLETLYNTYDLIAKKRKVFKVETIGDCYMAVTGLPEPRADHAIAMCKFAHECLSKMHGLLAGLSVTLGPGTADLSMRFGIHSGPVTAGVIRSQNARFQLFGDTVNTASRMESTGEPGLIHLSQETADQLISHGKKHWFVPRADKVQAKGKGELQTYWLTKLVSDDDRSVSTPSVNSAPTDGQDESGRGITAAALAEAKKAEEAAHKQQKEHEAKITRLVEWNVDVLNRLLGLIVARRAKRGKTSVPNDALVMHSYGPMVVDQMQEAQLPMFDPSLDAEIVDPAELESKVVDELYDYVQSITKMYNDNSFHCYEHASHVAMSVLKLMGRIVLPNDIQPEDARNAFSDPLTQFACVLSALVHDVGHTGVPNAQLSKENRILSMYYNGQSVAEQNSIDVAWALLMKPEYSHLRSAIFCDEDEMHRFRYLMVSAIMATDLFDDKLKAIRNMRWQRAFALRPGSTRETPQVISSRKATIVIEHLMQASDLAHTMQHWHVYRKWNERYFSEIVTAYQAGRGGDKDPSIGFYQSELSFFNNYVIPLARKLKDCGVFGVSSEEYHNYAVKNRDQWESQGKEIVEDMIAKLAAN